MYSAKIYIFYSSLNKTCVPIDFWLHMAAQIGLYCKHTPLTGYHTTCVSSESAYCHTEDTFAQGSHGDWKS